jgi:hypothetical protein
MGLNWQEFHAKFSYTHLTTITMSILLGFGLPFYQVNVASLNSTQVSILLAKIIVMDIHKTCAYPYMYHNVA